MYTSEMEFYEEIRIFDSLADSDPRRQPIGDLQSLEDLRIVAVAMQTNGIGTTILGRLVPTPTDESLWAFGGLYSVGYKGRELLYRPGGVIIEQGVWESAPLENGMTEAYPAGCEGPIFALG